MIATTHKLLWPVCFVAANKVRSYGGVQIVIF